MRRLSAVYLVVLAILLSFAATGVARAQSIDYENQTSSNVTVLYFSLPAGTQLFLHNWVSGAETAAAVAPVSGTGSVVVPFSGLPSGAGEYCVVARQSGTWISQTVVFYLFI